MFGILICDMIGYTNKTKCSFTTPFFSAYCSEHRILDFGNSNLPKDLESLLYFVDYCHPSFFFCKNNHFLEIKQYFCRIKMIL